ncbi:MBL fold metallo-hydrolase [Chloroflexota bacterium]
MFFQRIKSEGIAHNSYMVASGSEAFVVDPRRDCQVYVDLARQEGVRIRYIFETHGNEDYVVGSLELQQSTGAEIFHGPGLEWKYGNMLSERQEFIIGRLKLTAIGTPGHTHESMSYVLTDISTGNEAVIVFTGDALFVGDVGRTDFYGVDNVPKVASSLYDSIFNKILPLGDGVILCPAHGSGSVCGINIASRDESTLGIEKRQNPVLRLTRKEDFVKFKMAEKPEVPYYFRQMEKYNLEGPPLLGCMPLPAPLTPKEFKLAMEKGAVVYRYQPPGRFRWSAYQGGLQHLA